MYWYFFVESFFTHLQTGFSWFDLHNGSVQSVATVILVIITIRSIREAQDTRKDTRLPIIKFEIHGPINYGREDQHLTLSAENIGYGLALNVRLNFTFTKMELVDFANIEPGSKEIVHLNVSPEKLTQIKKTSKLIDVTTLSYKDIFDRVITTFSTIVDKNENSNRDWPDLTVSSWRINLPE